MRMILRPWVLSSAVAFILSAWPCVAWVGAAPPDDCEWVPEQERVEKYDTAFYHSRGFNIFPELTNPKSFCRTYKADKDNVSKTVLSILPRLGNPIALSDVANGVFTTNIIERGHLGARWQDSYSITVAQEGQGETTVRVLRTLHIKQGGRSKSMRQHPSDGQNEKWVLTQIAEGLASLPPKAPATSAGSAKSEAAPAGDLEAKLRQLAELREKNLVSDEEYQAMRKRLLEGMVSPTVPPAKP